jgi:hypothetical protein
MRLWQFPLLAVAVVVAGCSAGDGSASTELLAVEEAAPSSSVIKDEEVAPPDSTIAADEPPVDAEDAPSQDGASNPLETSPPDSFGELAVAPDGLMPSLSADFQPRFYGFYKGVFLADGYPGRRLEGDTLVAHPIYGVYVLNDYTTQLRLSVDNDEQASLRTAIRMVADSAIARMEEVGQTDALGFYYEPDWGLGARITERHYSGLTQAYYALALERVAQVLDDPLYSDAARRVYASLLVPASDGGVMIPSATGPAFAELPSEPESYVLNGWLSVLSTMINYGETVQDPSVIETVASSADRLVELLPLYDVPALANSRYGLTGFVTVRVRASESGVAVKTVTLDINEGEPIDVPATDGEEGRWSTYRFEEDFDGGMLRGSSFRANLVLSMVAFPETNELSLELGAEAGTAEFELEAQVGRYDPAWTGPIDRGWEVISDGVVEGNRVTFELEWEKLGPVIYPTNFAKDIDGESANVYHLIHVNRLRTLAEALSMPELSVWADQWEAAVCDWDVLDVYDGFAVSVKGRTVPVEDVDEAFDWCAPSPG